jgi:uncharacterized protein YkwD
MTGAKTNRLHRSKPLHHLKQLVVPTPHNDYKPHLSRFYGIILVLVVVVVAQFAYASSLANHILGSESRAVAELLAQTNAERTQAGLSPLTISSRLSTAAAGKAQDMFDRQYWAHNAPDGTAPWHFITDTGYSYTKAGENLAQGFNSTSAVTAAWMASPTHRDNLMNPDYAEIGLAVLDGNYGGRATTLIVAMYATPTNAVLAPPNTNAATTLGATETTLSSTETSATLGEQFTRGLRSLAPSLILSLALLGLAFIATMLAHRYRHRIPAHFRTAWHHYHTPAKVAFIALLALTAILSYGSGII